MKEIKLVQGTDEWLEFRKTSIGASSAAAILDVSPFKSSWQLYNEMVGISAPQEKTFAMQRGLDSEDAARRELQELTGHVFVPRVFQSTTHPWMHASLDGITADLQRAVEIKTPGKKDHDLAKIGRIPDHYYPQLQHIMYVCELEWMYYFSYKTGDSILLEIERSQKYIDNMVEREFEFLTRLLYRDAPEKTERDNEKKYTVMDGEEWNLIVGGYKLAIEQIEYYTSLKEKYKESLIQLSGESNAKGSGISLCKTKRRGAVDYMSIPQLQGISLDQYRAPDSEYWSVKVEKEKEIEVIKWDS